MSEALAVSSVELGGHFQGSLLGMILNAGFMVQFILLLLVAFSVVLAFS